MAACPSDVDGWRADHAAHKRRDSRAIDKSVAQKDLRTENGHAPGVDEEDPYVHATSLGQTCGGDEDLSAAYWNVARRLYGRRTCFG